MGEDMNWFIRYKRGNIEALRASGQFSPLDCVLLGNRDIATAEAAAEFLNPDVERMHDPYAFNDMDVAVNAVIDCLSAGAPIRIIGDYDQDGVSATTILVTGLRRIAEDMGYDPFSHRQLPGSRSSRGRLRDQSDDGGSRRR